MGVNIMLGRRCITPGARSRMASEITDTFGYAHRGTYAFVEEDIPDLSALAERGGQRSADDGRNPEISDAFHEIVKEVEDKGQAVVRLVY